MDDDSRLSGKRLAYDRAGYEQQQARARETLAGAKAFFLYVIDGNNDGGYVFGAPLYELFPLADGAAPLPGVLLLMAASQAVELLKPFTDEEEP